MTGHPWSDDGPCHSIMVRMDVDWPDRRLDVLAALDCLAAASPELGSSGMDQRWPDLTNAVHWLIDDTWWDHTDPSGDVGTILASEAEADAVRSVVAVLLQVAERQGADGSDSAWFRDHAWSTVRQFSSSAADVMRTV